MLAKNKKTTTKQHTFPPYHRDNKPDAKEKRKIIANLLTYPSVVSSMGVFNCGFLDFFFFFLKPRVDETQTATTERDKMEKKGRGGKRRKDNIRRMRDEGHD